MSAWEEVARPGCLHFKVGWVSKFAHLHSQTARLNRRRLLASSDGSEDQQGLGSGGNGVRQWGVGLLVGEILAAGEEAQEWPALLRDMVADRSAQHRIMGFERVEDGALRGLASNLEFDFTANVRQPSQMWRENNADHASVWTSTESTGGKSRTIGAQLSPASADA